MNDDEILVTGGSGLLGRWLLAALTRRGARVHVLLRGAAERAPELRAFVGSLGGVPDRLEVHEGDVERPGLGLSAPLSGVRDVYHLAARFGFGLSVDEARRANVEGTLHVAELAASLPRLRRFVFVGGYRMTRPPAALSGLRAPYDAVTIARVYAAHGAYEASKHESYAALKQLATARGLPLTVVHPSSVIGDSRTGRTTQLTGLGETVEQLWNGTLPALVGTADTFVPVVTVDHLADVLASVPLDPATLGEELVVLDPRTPNLPALIGRVAAHLGVPAPRWTLPAALVRALPRALTGLDPETLHFLSEDRYDTTSTDAHLARMGLARPDLDAALDRWVDHLVASRFLRASGPGGRLEGGIFVDGDLGAADVLLLHGIPWNADAWGPVLSHLPGVRTARVDLPGLGRSAGERAQIFDELGWLERLLARRTEPILLVGLSIGAQVAVRLAEKRPDLVRGVVAIVPAFLQRPPRWVVRVPALVAPRLRRAEPSAFAARIVGTTELAPGGDAAIASVLTDLRRSGVAARYAAVLAEAARAGRRAEAVRSLEALTVPVTLVVGSEDRLAAPRPSVIEIAGAGHHLHVTHPAELAAVVRQVLAAGHPTARVVGRHVAEAPKLP